MRQGNGPVPAPPEGLRPAQLGVVMLGRVIIGDIGATLVDLAIRRLLDVQSAEGDGAVWQVAPLDSSVPSPSRASLLGYERILLHGLASDGVPVIVAETSPRLPQLLKDTRREIIRDAVQHGWLRRLHHERRTPEGDKLAERIRAFQRRLRRYASDRGSSALSGPLLPYALHFGMLSDSDLPLVHFAHHWARSLSALPGWHQPAPRKPNPLEYPVPLDNNSIAYQHGYMYPPSP
jgi:hypothetical protein